MYANIDLPWLKRITELNRTESPLAESHMSGKSDTSTKTDLLAIKSLPRSHPRDKWAYLPDTAPKDRSGNGAGPVLPFSPSIDSLRSDYRSLCDAAISGAMIYGKDGRILENVGAMGFWSYQGLKQRVFGTGHAFGPDDGEIRKE